MAKKSKLLAALDAHQGRDYAAEKRKSQVKAADKRKRQRVEKNGVGATEPTAEPGAAPINDDTPEGHDFDTFSDDGSEDGHDEDVAADEDEEEDVATTTIPQPDQLADASASEAENESDVALSDLDDEDLEDTIPHQRLTINNGPALRASRKRIALLGKHRTTGTTKAKSTPFHIHNSLISTLPSAGETIPDPNDDLTRELEFYRIARDGAVQGRSLLQKEKVPFTRPTDYFAEMVKTDEHMGKIKKKLYDDAAGKKASQEARKLRDAKKFGKAVQVAKEQERAKEKRNTLDKIKELKRSTSQSIDHCLIGPPSPSFPFLSDSFTNMVCFLHHF
jgi:rRNA-processing protein EBP2